MVGRRSGGGALAAALWRRDFRTSLILGLAVFSYWILDFFTHPMGAIFGGAPLPPDLPLFFAGSPMVGLGLYNHSYSLTGIAAYAVFKIAEKRDGRSISPKSPGCQPR